MKFKKDEALKKSKRPAGSIVLYIAAIIVAIIGIADLVTNIVLFQQTVAQYVAQGYPAATVTSQLLPQMLSGFYEPIAVYGGVALLLFSAGMINRKLSHCLKMLEVENPPSDDLGENEFAPSELEAAETETAENKTAEHDSGKPEIS